METDNNPPHDMYTGKQDAVITNTMMSKQIYLFSIAMKKLMKNNRIVIFLELW